MLLASSLVLAGAGLLARWRAHRLRSGDSLAVLAVLVLLAIPVLPGAMNGSDFFSQRLMIFPWLAVLAAAGGYASPQRLSRGVPAFAILLALFALVAAEVFFRPVAQELFALEHQVLPQHTRGLAILDPAMLKAVRVQHQLGFNPYLWSGALPFLHANAVMLNSPFMDQKITPLMPAAGSDLLIDQMSSPDQAEHLINGNIDLPALPTAVRSALLRSTQAIVFVGTPEDVARGMAPIAGEGAAAAFSCTAHGGYLVCLAEPCH